MSLNETPSHEVDAPTHCQTLLITEVYASIQGESSFAGKPCTFIRLTGCPLRCRWCDSAYAFAGGRAWSLPEVIKKVEDIGLPLVEVTGGEPLAQPVVKILMNDLLTRGYQVLLETGGSESLVGVPSAVHVVMDLKCPDSKMHERNHWANLERLKKTDEVKFVVASRQDFDWAVAKMREHDLARRFQVLVSPAFGLLKPAELAKWMIEAKLTARLNLQQHKYIWGPKAKGV